MDGYARKPVEELSPEELAAIWNRTAPVVRVPWTADMALKVAGVTPDMPRDVAVGRIRDAIDQEYGGIPPEGLEALLRAGWSELED